MSAEATTCSNREFPSRARGHPGASHVSVHGTPTLKPCTGKTTASADSRSLGASTMMVPPAGWLVGSHTRRDRHSPQDGYMSPPSAGPTRTAGCDPNTERTGAHRRPVLPASTGLRSSDAGTDWSVDWTSSEAPSANIPLEGISGPSIYKCYAAGQDSNFDAQITRTANGGSSWVKQTLPSATFASGDSSLSSIDCPSKLDCYAVGWQFYASRATTCPTF